MPRGRELTFHQVPGSQKTVNEHALWQHREDFPSQICRNDLICFFQIMEECSKPIRDQLQEYSSPHSSLSQWDTLVCLVLLSLVIGLVADIT